MLSDEIPSKYTYIFFFNNPERKIEKINTVNKI